MIQAEHLSKTYSVIDKEVGLKGSIKAFFKPKKKLIPAVQDISLQVEKGEIIGYIGSNGSGKSTTIKMLTGVLFPDQGQVRINVTVKYLFSQSMMSYFLTKDKSASTG